MSVVGLNPVNVKTERRQRRTDTQVNIQLRVSWPALEELGAEPDLLEG